MNTIENYDKTKAIVYVDGSIAESKTKQAFVNSLCFYEDYSLVLYSNNGIKVFTREEALSQIITVEMIDFPLTTLQEEYEDEFGSVDSNIIVMFYKRIKSQALQLKVSVQPLGPSLLLILFFIIKGNNRRTFKISKTKRS